MELSFFSKTKQQQQNSRGYIDPIFKKKNSVHSKNDKVEKKNKTKVFFCFLKIILMNKAYVCIQGLFSTKSLLYL